MSNRIITTHDSVGDINCSIDTLINRKRTCLVSVCFSLNSKLLHKCDFFELNFMAYSSKVIVVDDVKMKQFTLCNSHTEREFKHRSSFVRYCTISSNLELNNNTTISNTRNYICVDVCKYLVTTPRSLNLHVYYIVI